MRLPSQAKTLVMVSMTGLPVIERSLLMALFTSGGGFLCRIVFCRAARGGLGLLQPAEERVVGAVLRTVVDAEVLLDVAPEPADLTLVGRVNAMAPVGHGEHVSEVDGLGVVTTDVIGSADAADRSAGCAEKRVDQWLSPVAVEPVASPEAGDVGCLGERGGGCLAAMMSSQPVVASLGMDDLGEGANVVLPAAVATNGRPEPDAVAWAEHDLGGLPGDCEDERAAATPEWAFVAAKLPAARYPPAEQWRCPCPRLVRRPASHTVRALAGPAIPPRSVVVDHLVLRWCSDVSEPTGARREIPLRRKRRDSCCFHVVGSRRNPPPGPADTQARCSGRIACKSVRRRYPLRSVNASGPSRLRIRWTYAVGGPEYEIPAQRLAAHGFPEFVTVCNNGKNG